MRAVVYDRYGPPAVTAHRGRAPAGAGAGQVLRSDPDGNRAAGRR